MEVAIIGQPYSKIIPLIKINLLLGHNVYY